TNLGTPWMEREGTSSVWDVKAVIYAAGATPRMVNVPGEKELTGRGVSYCATCDAPFFRDKEVVVIGGGDTALDEGHYLTRFAAKVTIVHRREQLRAEQILQDRAFQNQKIHFELPYLPVEIQGDSKVEGLQIRHRDSGEMKTIPCEGVFVFVGYDPSTGLLARLADLDDGGYVKTDDNMRTKVPGLFACGDCRSKLLRQAITACGEGATAAVAASHYVESLSH
ncbi:MAG TPA: FAD-dependent oxidoreductase, partial [bacterium]|nr:FAD-dependent oxidoreductase [bacterium]